MGRAARWLRNLLGGGSGKKEANAKEQKQKTNASVVEERRDKKRWSFAKSSRDSVDAAAPAAPPAVGQNQTIAKAAEAAWLKSLYAETEREQSKHAIAVAAATAAAADAAVAAAQAAVAVVRLTSQGPLSGGNGAGIHEKLAAAAVVIQTAFRGFLSKKALRALKALVKLQALVRGYLVRKQAAATLQSMQALVRAQATIRAQKSRCTNLIRPRRSLQERYDDTRSEHGVPAYFSRRLSASIDSYGGYDRSPKIVEVDTGRPKSRSSSSRRTSPPVLDAGDDYPNSVSSPLPCNAPPRISIPSCRNFQDYDWCYTGIDKCRGLSVTAQSTPRYMNSCGNMPVTPAKSVSGAAERLLYAHCPNYMSNTQSFEAKVRSQSAPKQRPEPGIGGGNAGMRKRVPLSEVLVESRASLSGIGMQRSCNRVQEQFNFKSAVVGRLDRSSEAGNGAAEREMFLQRKW